MSATDALIEKIISDSKQKQQQTLDNAQAEAQVIIQRAQDAIEVQKQEFDKKCQAEGEEIVRRRMSLAHLELRKKQLAVRQSLVERAYEEAAKALFADDAQYLLLVAKLIDCYAEDGESVTICADDKNRITAAFLAKRSKKVTLAQKYGDFRGGIILSTGKYEKNLTLELLMKQCREKTEAQVVESLYGRGVNDISNG